MKMRVQHIVPLAPQAVSVLEEVEAVTGRFALAFPSLRSRFRPMSANTLTAAIRRMGYTGDDMTAHGFRTPASTMLNEQGWNSDAIERQLAHEECNAVRADNCAQHLPERCTMMQTWGNCLDQLKLTGSPLLNPKSVALIALIALTPAAQAI